MKIKTDTNEQLLELMEHECFPALISYIDSLRQASIDRLLSYNSNGTPESEKLIVNEKLKHDGILLVKNSLLSYRQKLIKGEKK